MTFLSTIDALGWRSAACVCICLAVSHLQGESETCKCRHVSHQLAAVTAVHVAIWVKNAAREACGNGGSFCQTQEAA